MAKSNRRERTTREDRANAQDRTDRVLRSAARWLKRRGASRQSRESRGVYNQAASLILNRVRR